MEASAECTHCRVVMTSWSAPGSAIRYYQCPFCARTHSSLYGEVFRRRAGARLVGAPAASSDPARLPMPSEEEIRWGAVKARAARWFARLEAEGRPIERISFAALESAEIEDGARVDAPAAAVRPAAVATALRRAR